MTPVSNRPIPFHHEASGQRTDRDPDSMARAWRKHNEVNAEVFSLQRTVAKLALDLANLRRRGGEGVDGANGSGLVTQAEIATVDSQYVVSTDGKNILRSTGGLGGSETAGSLTINYASLDANTRTASVVNGVGTVLASQVENCNPLYMPGGIVTIVPLGSPIYVGAVRCDYIEIMPRLWVRRYYQ